MRDIIKKTFENVLIETEKTENIHFIGSGYLIPEDKDVVFAYRKTLPEKNYQQLLSEVGRLLDEINELYVRGSSEKALDAYEFLLHESLHLLNEAIGLSEESLSQISTLLDSIADKCIDEVHEIIGATGELSLVTKHVDWLLNEVSILNSYGKYSYDLLIDSFRNIYESTPSLVKQALKSINAGIEPEPLETCLLKYNFFHESGQVDVIEDLLAVNKYAFALHKHHLETLANGEKVLEATSYARKYLEFVNNEFEYLSGMNYEERNARIESFPDKYINPFMIWCTRFLVDSLIYLKQYDEAFDLVLEMFTYTSKKGMVGRLSGVERIKHYTSIADSLPEALRKTLSEKFFEIAKKLPLSYEMEKICELENNWLPLIKSFKYRKGISSILYTYDQYKQHLKKYPDELNEVFKIAITKFVEIGTDRDRRSDVIKSLTQFLKFKGGKPYVFELIFEFKSQYSRRKTFLELLDDFINIQNLDEEYGKYELERSL